MASVRQSILKQIFEALEKRGKKLHRFDDNPSNIRFSKTRQNILGDSMAEVGEPGGIYYGKDPVDVDALVAGTERMTNPSQIIYKPNIEAIPRVGSRVKAFNETEWAPYAEMDFGRLTKNLKKRYDFVEFPDVAAGHPEISQVVQLNRNKAIGRIKDASILTKTKDSHEYVTHPEWYKVLGASGIGAASAMGLPDEAEASPLKKAYPGIWATMKSALRSLGPVGKEMRKTGAKDAVESSANEVLKGKPFRDGKIAGVYQGVGDERFLHMDNGVIYPLKKNDVHELAAEFGTQGKMGEFKGKPPEAQWQQILTSLEYNRKRSVPPGIGGMKAYREQIYENYAKNVGGMLGDESKIADQVLVRDMDTKHYWLWPRVYAEPAEAAGLVKIDKTFKLRGK